MIVDFTGWPLEEARAAIENDGCLRHLPLRLVSTAPPRQSTTLSGQWRVLRCRIAQPANESSSEVVLEITSARAQIIGETPADASA